MAYSQQMGNSRSLLGGIVGAATLAGALIIGLGPMPATAAHPTAASVMPSFGNPAGHRLCLSPRTAWLSQNGSTTRLRMRPAGIEPAAFRSGGERSIP